MRSPKTKTLLTYIAANVRRARERKNLTQESLAESASVDIRYLQRVERGTINLSIDVLSALSEALGVTPATLLRPAKLKPPKVGRPKKKGSSK
jgi:transcriptional regulator with XRE-family HTH domain